MSHVAPWHYLKEATSCKDGALPQSPHALMSDTPIFSTAAVAAPHPLAADAGLNVLALGGNAVEAVVAMAAASAVLLPHAGGLGGDGMWMVREPSGRVHVLDGLGKTGAQASAARYRTLGYDSLPAAGPHAALTAAGAVAGWHLALDLARHLGGRLPLGDLMAEALRIAREGSVPGEAEMRLAAARADDLSLAPGFAEAFLVDGKPPPAGHVRRSPALAGTLEHLVHAGLEDFYRGDVGREVAADLERWGSPVTRRDLAACRAVRREPLSLAVRGGTLHATPAPGRGLQALLSLGIVARLGLPHGEGVAAMHGLIEATARAQVLAEDGPEASSVLSADALEREAEALDGRRASTQGRRPADVGAGVWIGAVDAAGTVVSYAGTLGPAFGSGCVLPRTGLVWQARGADFSLEPLSDAVLRPGLQPHGPALPVAAFDDGRVAVAGVGGPGEVEAAVTDVAHHVLFGSPLPAAMAAPRWRFAPWGEAGERAVWIAPDADPSLVAALRRAGHRLEEIDDPDAFGAGGCIARQARGSVEAACDARSGGAVAGL